MGFSHVYVLLVALHVGSSSMSMPTNAEADDGITLLDSNDIREYVMPDSCDGQSYCFEKGADYPDKEIEKLVDKVLTTKVESFEPRINFGPRFGGSESECPYNSTENPIYYITDTSNKVRVVVQSPKFKQIYSVKWCQNEGSIKKDTRHLLKNDVERLNFECVTTRINYIFFVLNDNQVNRSELTMEVARAKGGIPVSCRCQYPKTDNIRMPHNCGM